METRAGWILMAGIVLLRARAAHGQNVLRGASTCPPVPVKCDPASALLIRTAEYRKPTTPATANQCTGGTCTGSGCNMRDDDIIRVYRKCGENVTYCDLLTADVGLDFRIDYYCLTNEDLKDPCKNLNSQWPGSAGDNRIIFYVNYARYSLSQDFMCQCLVTSSDNKTTMLAMNLYDNLHPGGRVPNVMIDTGRFTWSVGQRTLPAQWGLQNSSASLLFENVNGADFGHLVLDFRGQGLGITCNSTLEGGGGFATPSPSAASSTSDSISGPTSSTGTQLSESGPSLLVIIAAAAASGAFVILVIVIVVVTIKCRRLSARNKELANIKLPAHELNTVSRRGSPYTRDGEYCDIADLKPPPVMGVVRSRDGRKSFSHDYEPNSRDYKPTSRDYEPSSRDYKSAPRDYKRTSPDYEPTSRDCEKPSRDDRPSSHDYRPMPRSVQLHTAYDATVQALKQGQMAARAKSQKKPEISTISSGGDGLPRDASARAGRWDDHGAYASSSVTSSHGAYASSSVTSSEYGSLYRKPGQMTSPASPDSVIYDRAGYFRPGDGPQEDVYNSLRYGKLKEKIIDNVYDNSTFV